MFRFCWWHREVEQPWKYQTRDLKRHRASRIGGKARIAFLLAYFVHSRKPVAARCTPDNMKHFEISPPPKVQAHSPRTLMYIFIPINCSRIPFFFARLALHSREIRLFERKFASTERTFLQFCVHVNFRDTCYSASTHAASVVVEIRFRNEMHLHFQPKVMFSENSDTSQWYKNLQKKSSVIKAPRTLISLKNNNVEKSARSYWTKILFNKNLLSRLFYGLFKFSKFWK